MNLASMRIFSCITGLALLMLACGQEEPGTSRTDQKELLLFCGAGIRPPVAELAEIFGREHNVKVITDYAGSEVLLSKIKLGKRGDLYMPGDRHYTDMADKEGLILSRKAVCFFVPTILVQKGNPKNIAGLRDLARPGIRLGLGDPRSCAIGRKSIAIFEKNNIPWSEVEKNLKFQSITVNELGMQIQADSLDAVIVWDAIAEYYAGDGDVVAIPVEQNLISTVEVATLKFTTDREMSERFVEFANSERGKAIFRKHKYRVEPLE